MPTEVSPAAYDEAVAFMRKCHSHLGPGEGHERAFMTANLRLYRYWGASFWLGSAEGEPVTLVVARPGRARKKGPWGRYVNFYLVYTDKPHRGNGYSFGTAQALRRQWADEGQSRIKARASSYGGFAHFWAFGDHFWGLHEGDLVVDAPLNRTQVFPPSVPVEARPYSTRQLSREDLLTILTDPHGRFRATEGEARERLGI